ncbi:MAG: uracil-DNA glycosylase [Crocinitomix sp.]|nr:uracil-DNA glycosylase [Crocinitomix sp.]
MDLKFEASWKTALGSTFEQPYFKQLVEHVAVAYNSNDVWPRERDVFKAFDHCPINKIKVVILGQDPYPTPGHAHGLCFSVPESVKPLAKSLKNIFKEIQSDLKIETPEHGNLERWATQGVFLLNTVLTVNAYSPNSHKKFGWETFTEKVIETISEQQDGVVFLLWGAQAQQKAKLIDSSKHHILTAPHPSPLSAYRGFFGCKHFSKTNELLALQNKTPINW